MRFRVNATEKWRNRSRKQKFLQVAKRLAAGVAQNQVELPKSLGWKIIDRLSPAQPLEGYRGIEVIERAYRSTRAKYQFAGLLAIRTVAGSHGEVGILQTTTRLRPYFIKRLVELECAWLR